MIRRDLKEGAKTFFMNINNDETLGKITIVAMKRIRLIVGADRDFMTSAAIILCRLMLVL